MREIKFRQAIIHPVTKKFWRWHYWGFIDGCFIGPSTGTCSLKEAHKNSQQYIGLKDKNGKEIYEGDIIEFNTDTKSRRAVIEFQVHCYNAGFYPSESVNANCHWKVIGNVYNNPKLLEVKK